MEHSFTTNAEFNGVKCTNSTTILELKIFIKI